MKFEELKVGMLVERGLILETIPAGTDSFWGDKNAVITMCINDAYYGPGGCCYGKADWKILHDSGTPEYSQAVAKMIEEKAHHADNAAKDCELLLKFM